MIALGYDMQVVDSGVVESPRPRGADSSLKGVRIRCLWASKLFIPSVSLIVDFRRSLK